MGEEMQQDAVDCATQALEKYNIEKVINVHQNKGNTTLIAFPPFNTILCLFFFDPTRKHAENRYAIALMHARQS